MKKSIIDFGGLILFYLVIVIGVLLLNLRFSYLNNSSDEKINNSYLAMNK